MSGVGVLIMHQLYVQSIQQKPLVSGISRKKIAGFCKCALELIQKIVLFKPKYF